MATQFAGFSRRDFEAFTDLKKENALFNNERKVVWKKMKKLQTRLEIELNYLEFPLEGKISQYWINYTKRHVNGIWLAYTDIAPYYIVCQLNCGIYKDGFFVGIEINPKAYQHLENVQRYVSQNKKEFLSILRQLDSRYFHLACGDRKASSPDLSSEDLERVLEVAKEGQHWFDLGEWYPRQEGFLTSADVASRIPKIFEILFPLYLVFAGRRPLGCSTQDRLLRLNDTKKSDLSKVEKKIASDVGTLTLEQLDKLIADIDKRNKAETPQRFGRKAQTYRRNPVLSTALKKKHLDRCQVCGLNLKVNKGFFCDTHHILPLREGGLDMSENILVLCPNHHRFFDRSKYEIISKEKSTLAVKVSDETLRIKL